MQPLLANQIFGTWATVLLPLNDDDTIDYERLSEEVDALIRSGVDGIYTNGTAAEFYSQSEDEFDRIQQIVAEKCEKAGMRFQIGASHMSPQLSLERIKRAKELKPGAIQVILADWYPLSKEERLKCLTGLAEAADPIGIVLYAPPHAKNRLDPPAYGDFKRHISSLIGLKTAGGDDAWYAAVKRECPGLALFVPGSSLATGFAKGAAGAYSNMACVNPKAACDWFSMMQRDIGAALELEERIHAFMAQCIRPYMNKLGYAAAAVDKLMVAVGGWCNLGTRLRWPYNYIDSGDVEGIRAIAKRMIPEFFVD